MLVLRIARKKTNELQDISRKALSLSKKYHLPRKNGKFPLHTSCFLSSNINPLKEFRCHLHCSAINYEIRPDAEKNSIDSCQYSDDECSNARSCSEEEAEDYRKMNNITVKGKNIPRPITQFSELQIPETLKVLIQENYSEPTPIQAQGWPVAFIRRDMVGVSQTGSGKTLAYMLPAVMHASKTNYENQNSNRNRNMQSPKVLVLGPTRELVQQILNVSRRFIQTSRLRGACAYGGASKIPQLRNLRGAQICVATPGRLLDYLENDEVSLKDCDYLVLDEADRMLDMGFEPQIREIIDQIPHERQTLMWSATWPKEIRSLAEEFLTNYIHITVGDVDLVANPNIHQNIYVVREEEKFERFFSLLSNILQNEQSKVLVFAETKKNVDYVTRLLNRQQLVAWGIHGDCSQRKRDHILQEFRRTTPSVLIATDIASRGLDISDIHHVVNYDFPQNIESYIHRIGRTARGSASGESHSFFTEENCGVLRELISVLKKANQPISPDLLSLYENSSKNNYSSSKNYYGGPKNWYKPQKRYGEHRYGFNKPFGRNKMYREM